MKKLIRYGIITSKELTLSFSIGSGASVGFGGSLTGFIMLTNAPSIDKLNGMAYQVGGSAGLEKCLGGDFIFIPDGSEAYNGMDVNFGYCTPGKEIHIIRGVTQNIEKTKINVFDTIKRVYLAVNGGWT